MLRRYNSYLLNIFATSVREARERGHLKSVLTPNESIISAGDTLFFLNKFFKYFFDTQKHCRTSIYLCIIKIKEAWLSGLKQHSAKVPSHLRLRRFESFCFRQMEFWQTWCMRGTENPENVVRIHEIPQKYAPVAQMDRAPRYERGGRRFESCPEY